jgi:hypothetical protein
MTVWFTCRVKRTMFVLMMFIVDMTMRVNEGFMNMPMGVSF